MNRTGAPTPATAGRPVLRVIRGDPTPAELAALVAVLAARSRGVRARRAERARQAAIGGWADRRAGLGRRLPVGPGAWAAAGAVPGTRTRAGW